MQDLPTEDEKNPQPPKEETTQISVATPVATYWAHFWDSYKDMTLLELIIRIFLLLLLLTVSSVHSKRHHRTFLSLESDHNTFLRSHCWL
jgi:hypothetical protein